MNTTDKNIVNVATLNVNGLLDYQCLMNTL